jgi:hypothetical protein
VAEAVRTAAFTAALAEFDALAGGEQGATTQVAALTAVPPAGPPVAPPPNVVPLHRQRRWSRGLGIAAAVALLGVVGVAAANLTTGSSNDSASLGTARAEVDTLTSAGDSSKVGTAANTNDQPVVAPEGGVGTETTAGSPPQTGQTIESIDGGGSTAPAYSDPQSLRSLPEPKVRVTPSFVLQCTLPSQQEILLEITWKGTPAVVVRDTVTGVIAVLDDQCTTLVTVPN